MHILVESGGSSTDAYIGPQIGVPVLKICGEGHSLTTDDVDEGQTYGGTKTSVQLLVDLLLISDHKEGAGCCEANNAGPHHNQEQPLQIASAPILIPA